MGQRVSCPREVEAGWQAWARLGASSASAVSPSWALTAACLAALEDRASRDQAEAHSCLHHPHKKTPSSCVGDDTHTPVVNACTSGAPVVVLLKSGRPQEIEKAGWEDAHPLGWEAAWGLGCGVGGR